MGSYKRAPWHGQRVTGDHFFIGSLAAVKVLLGSMIVMIVSFWIIEINEVLVGIYIGILYKY
jgi:hypothetical protein